MKDDILEKLSKSPVFKGINPEEISVLLRRIEYHIINRTKGNIIAYRGDECNKLMILLDGEIKAEMSDSDGKTIEVETLYPPKPIAPAFIFSKKIGLPT